MMDRIEWLREQITGDLEAAKIIGAGGFAPQRWDTDAPGQVNPEGVSGSGAVNDALGLDPDDYEHPGHMPGWVALYAYERLNNEPPEMDARDSPEPAVLANHGRREFDHIRRQDPRNAIARCEAELAILDVHPITTDVIPPGYRAGTGQPFGCGVCHDWDGVTEGYGYCKTVTALASGYRHRPGFEEHWGTPAP